MSRFTVHERGRVQVRASHLSSEGRKKKKKRGKGGGGTREIKKEDGTYSREVPSFCA